MQSVCLEGLETELRNPSTTEIDTFSTNQLLSLMNNEDLGVVHCVKNLLPVVANVVDELHPKIKKGGRLFYLGAGTSGRLGILDASEIPPTFSVPSDQFIGLIAGGDVALRKAQENAEDNETAAVEDLEPFKLNPELDTILGIASSGRTPYVIGALRYAKKIGCSTIGIACVEKSEMGRSGFVDHMISAVTGPEIITGSTRLKAGTATKLILNMISTATMVKIGKTYGNLMVDLMPTNLKLKERTRRIFWMVCGTSFYTCSDGKVSKERETVYPNHEGNKVVDNLLSNCYGSLKTSIIVAKMGVDITAAVKYLEEADGDLRSALTSSSLPLFSLPSEDSDEKSISDSLSSSYRETSSISSVDSVPKKIWGLCLDVRINEVRATLYNKVDLVTRELKNYSNLNEDLITVIDMVINIAFDNGDKRLSVSSLESVRVGIENIQDEKIILASLEKAYGLPRSKSQIVHGRSDYYELLKTVL
ncbi:uncharacterized protein PRCAT00002525001 [Priceomyces carsonii]|uniref:uncharacterized protein n=1 Tax=Priceomyces carsonii TaxID=28549 RepID=UPI002ED7F078|nr:unnamed protein product [Priceomyces carsonii]